MKLTRRNLLGPMALAAIASGLPLSALKRLGRGLLPEAHAQTATDTAPQFLILSTSGAGDPINTNAPGTYGVEGVFNNPHPEMAATRFQLGGVEVTAAKPWAELAPQAISRAAFIHHRTYQNAHPAYPKVMALLGKAKGRAGPDQIQSVLASELSPLLDTIQEEPVCMSGGDLTFQGRALPQIKPLQLKSMLAPVAGEQLALQQLRDKTIDGMHQRLRAEGTRAQQKWLDRYALSRGQARKVDDALSANFAMLDGDDAVNQVRAAVTLILMKMAPVITINIPFGGDNHQDANLVNERDSTVRALGTMNLLMDLLKSSGIEDQVTFANLNVFGRKLTIKKNPGRDHNLNHHTMVIIGKHVRAGVVGGIGKQGDDFGAEPFDSTTGKPSPGGDILGEESLESACKTLGRALGLGDELVNERILAGKVIPAALV